VKEKGTVARKLIGTDLRAGRDGKAGKDGRDGRNLRDSRWRKVLIGGACVSGVLETLN